MNQAPLALFNGSYLGNKPTGIGVVARDLVAALDPQLVAFLDPLGGSRLGSISIPSNLNPGFGSKGHIRRLIWTQRQLPLLMKTSGAQFLISPLPEAPLMSGVRSVVFAHDLLPLRYPQLSPLLAYHLLYVPLVLHSSMKVLCNSEATAQEVHHRLGIPIRKLVTIPLGFNQDKLQPLGLDRKPFFLVLGRHDPHKNLAKILDAISLLNDKELQVWFVGPQDKRYTPKLKQRAEKLKISKRCRWISWVSDEERLRLLNSCQALVIASLWEGFGLPALEAMACHTPVIASSGGALPEVVGNAAIIVDPLNPHSIADAMRMIISDITLRIKLIDYGIKRLKMYTWNNSAKIVESVLSEL